MGKIIKKVSKIVTIGAVVAVAAAAVVLSAGAAVPLSAAISAALASTVAGVSLGAIILVSGAVSAISTAFAKNKGSEIARDAIDRAQISLRPRDMDVWIFGTTAASERMIYAEVVDGDPQKSVIVIDHADHTITGYKRFWIDGELVGSSGTIVTGKWVGLLARQQRLGIETQTAMTLGAGALWTAAAQGKGRALQGLTFTVDPEVNPRGTPTRLVQEIDGSPVYDPRLDSTNGGVGPQRADDQTTWTFSRNAALIYGTYLLGWQRAGKLKLGVGYPKGEILWDSVIEGANVADANSWFFDGLLTMPESGGHGRNLREILNACAAEPIERGGKLGLRVPFDDTAAVELDIGPDRVMGAIERLGSGGIAERANIVNGQFIDSEAIYQPKDYPEIRLDAAIATEGPLLQELSFSGVQSSATAVQLATVLLLESRRERIQIMVDQTGLNVQVGDIVRLQLPDQGFNNVLARVRSLDWDFATANISLSLRRVDATDYAAVIPPAGAADGVPKLSSFDEVLGSVAAGTVPWTGVTDPVGTKPEDGADVTDLHSDSLVLNPSFEAGDKDWPAKGAGWSIVQDATNAFRGSWVARFDGTGNTAIRNGRFNPVAPGDRVRLSGWIKSGASATGECKITIRWWSATAAFGGQAGNTIPAGTTWRQSVALGTAPVGAVAWRPEFESQSTVTAGPWFCDAMEASVVSPDTMAVNGESAVVIKQRAAQVFTAFDASTNLRDTVRQLQDAGGGIARTVPSGVAIGVGNDGDSFVFTPARADVPIVRYIEGGTPGPDPAGTVAANWPVSVRFRAINATPNGFTLGASYTAQTSAQTLQSDAGAVADSPGLRIEKTVVAEASDDRYTAFFTGTINVATEQCFEIPPEFGGGEGCVTTESSVVYALDSRATSGSAWVERATLKRDNTSLTIPSSFASTMVATVDGLGIDAAWRVRIKSMSNNGGSLNGFQKVEYSVPGASSDVSESRTPAGADPITFEVLSSIEDTIS